MALPILAAASGIAQVAGGLFGNRGAKRSAEQQMQAAVIERKAANQNAKVFEARAGKIRENAKLVEWQGQYAATRIRQQAAINAKLAEVEYQETVRAADVVDLSTRRAVAFADTKAQEFEREAGEIDKAATTRAVRQYREGKTVLGKQRIATAQSGLVESGTELDRLVESASRLSLDRLDMLKEAGAESRRTRFAGKVATYEGQIAGFEGGEESRRLRFGAKLGKFNARVEEWNSQQEAALVLYETQIEAKNLRDEAKDIKTQAKLTRKYGKAAFAGAEAGAASTRFAGRLGVLSAVGDATTNVANWKLNRR